MLQHEMVTGFLTSIILLPQCIAYASLAGLPASVGISSSIVPSVLYAMVGKSKYLSFGPFAVTSMMVRHSLHMAGFVCTFQEPLTCFQNTKIMYANAAFVLAICVGVWQLLLSWKARVCTKYLAVPVIAGFNTAAAVLIIGSQMGNMVGVQSDASVLHQIGYVLHVQHWNVYDVSCTLFGIVLVQILPKHMPKQIILIIVSAVVVVCFSLQSKLDCVGKIPFAFPSFHLPHFDSEWTPFPKQNNHSLLLLLVPHALPVAFVSTVLSVSIAQTFADLDMEKLSPNGEVFSYGICNLFSGCFSCYPSSGSFSRTAIVYATSRKRITRRWNLFATISMLLMTAYSSILFENLPNATLSTIIALSVVKLISSSSFLQQLTNTDKFMWLVSVCSTLLLGLSYGILCSLLNSFLVAIYLLATSNVQHDTPLLQAHMPDHILLYSMPVNIVFYNAMDLQDAILTKISAQHKSVILSMCSVAHIDATGKKMLKELALFHPEIAFVYAGGNLKCLQSLQLESSLSISAAVIALNRN